MALAGLVALFSADRSEPAAAQLAAAPQLAEAQPAPAKISRASLDAAPAPLVDAEAEEDDPVAGNGSEDQPDVEANMGADPTLGDPDKKAPSVGPSSAEAGQLLASSRGRAGGVDQGDEPVRAPVS